MKPGSSGPRIAAAAVLALLLASCAAPLRYAKPVDPMAVLPPDAAIYLKLGRGALGDLAPPLLDSVGSAAPSSRYLKSMLGKTETAAVAAFPSSREAGPASPGGLPRFEAVLMGDYPYRSATLALGQDRQWKKDARGRALVSTAQGLGLSFAGRGIVLVASDGGGRPVDDDAGAARGAGGGPADAGRGASIEAAVEALVDRLLVAGASVIPPGLSALCDGDIVIWAPDPFGKLAASLLGGEAAEDVDIPAAGVLLSARRSAESPAGGAASAAGGAASAAGGPASAAFYELTIVFLMRNEEDARTFRPAIRLAWYGLSRSLLPGEAEAASLRFELSGEAVAASGLRVKASSLASALSMVARKAR